MPVDLAFTIPCTLIGLSAGRAAGRHRASAELTPSAARDWDTARLEPAPVYQPNQVYQPTTPNIPSPQMTARFYPNGQLADLRGPAEVVARTVLELRGLDHRAEIVRTAMEQEHISSWQAFVLSRRNALPPGGYGSSGPLW